MKSNVPELGIFVGMANLKDDLEVIKMQIPLSKFRFILVNVLQLHPFLKVMQNLIIEE